MIQILYMFFVCLVFLISFVLNKRCNKILLLLVIIYMIILMGGNTQNPDYQLYKISYESSHFYEKDIGYGFLITICKYINLNFNQFKLLTAIIGFLLIHFSVSKLVKNEWLFYLLYLIYPFFFDIVQIRNFLCMSFLIFATTLLTNNNRLNQIFFVLFVLIGASFQKIGLVYLPLILFINSKNKKIFKFILSFSIIFSVFIGLNKSLILNILANISLLNNLKGLENYMKINTNYGWIILWLEQIIAFVISRLALQIIENGIKKNLINKDSKLYKYVNIVYFINLYCFIFLPLFSLDENYTRIIRNVIPLNIILFVMILENKKQIVSTYNDTWYYKLYSILVYSYQLIMLALLANTYANNIIIPVFTENWIW